MWVRVFKYFQHHSMWFLKSGPQKEQYSFLEREPHLQILFPLFLDSNLFYMYVLQILNNILNK